MAADGRWAAGPMWGRRETPTGETETADELHGRLSLLGAELIVETVAAIERGDGRPLVQDATQACQAPKLSKADGVIDWSQPARVIARRINGLWSWPTATALLHPARGKSVQVQLARPVCAAEEVTEAGPFAPGDFLPDGSTKTGGGRIRLLELKPAGGKLMSFEQFANGRDVKPPARLGPIGPTH